MGTDGNRDAPRLRGARPRGEGEVRDEFLEEPGRKGKRRTGMEESSGTEETACAKMTGGLRDGAASLEACGWKTGTGES